MTSEVPLYPIYRLFCICWCRLDCHCPCSVFVSLSALLVRTKKEFLSPSFIVKPVSPTKWETLLRVCCFTLVLDQTGKYANKGACIYHSKTNMNECRNTKYCWQILYFLMSGVTKTHSSDTIFAKQRLLSHLSHISCCVATGREKHWQQKHHQSCGGDWEHGLGCV